MICSSPRQAQEVTCSDHCEMGETVAKKVGILIGSFLHHPQEGSEDAVHLPTQHTKNADTGFVPWPNDQ